MTNQLVSQASKTERKARRRYELGQTKRGLSQLSKGLTRFASRKPVVSALIALGAGALLVGLWGRRMAR